MDSLRTEVAIFKSVAHNGIIRMLDYFENSKSLYLCFERHMHYDDRIVTKEEAKSITDKADYGNQESLPLQHYILSQTTSIVKTQVLTFSENRAIDIAQNIAASLEYLHDIGIIVRDLDTFGIIMTQNSEHGIPRICNLKHACCISPESKTTGIFGDVHFRAPEVIQGQPYAHKADSWSFGVILYYMLTQTLPFVADEEHSVEHKIVNEQPNLAVLAELGYNESAIEVVQKLLNKNPVARLSMTATLRCAWFKKGADPQKFNTAATADMGKRYNRHLDKTLSKRTGSKGRGHNHKPTTAERKAAESRAAKEIRR